jgi:hypothetical protein
LCFEQACAGKKPNNVSLCVLAHAYGRAGKTNKARGLSARLQTLAKRRFVSPYAMALAAVGLREDSLALDWLETALHDHDYWIHKLAAKPHFDHLKQAFPVSVVLPAVGRSGFLISWLAKSQMQLVSSLVLFSISPAAKPRYVAQLL